MQERELEVLVEKAAEIYREQRHKKNLLLAVENAFARLGLEGSGYSDERMEVSLRLSKRRDEARSRAAAAKARDKRQYSFRFRMLKV
jgi:hypothetical protein